jgi:hypothetical protein
MSRTLAQSRPALRRGMSRQDAAEYLGISTTKFDELRAAGQIEPPRLIGTRKLWDIRDLDMAFEALPREDAPDLVESWVDDDG